MTKKYSSGKQKTNSRGAEKRYSNNSAHGQTTSITISTRPFNERLSAVDWKESYVSLTLGVIVVAFVIGFVLLFSKGKSMNFISFHHSYVAKTVYKNPTFPHIRPKQYTVKEGDDLSSIAQETYGNPEKWTKIAAENKLNNPDSLYTGQILIIPQ